MGNTSMVMRAILVGLLAIAVIAIPNSEPIFGQGGTWTTKASMPTPRNQLGAGVVNGTVYAVGGDNPPNYGLNTVEAYDPTANIWTTRASMSAGHNAPGVGVVNGILSGILYVVAGGTSCCYSNTVEAYDPLTNAWMTKAPVPDMARNGIGVGVINGILYAVGGQNVSTFFNTTAAYNPVTNIWTTKVPMPTARSGHGVGVVNGILYAVGGGNSSGFLNTVEAYDPTTDTWTTKAPMPTARGGLGVGVVNGILYAVGGYSSGTGSLVEAYNPITNTWSTGWPPMPTARFGFGVGVVTGTLYAVGGGTSSGVVSTNEAFTPTLEACPPSGQGECEQAEGEGNVDNGAGGNGDFSFIVRRPSTTQQISGFLQYGNQTIGAQVNSVSFSSLAIVGNTATFAGTCTENGVPCAFVVSVAAPLPNSPASFTITISGGTKVGGTLRAGNILVRILK